MYFSTIDKFRLLKVTASNAIKSMASTHAVCLPAIVWLMTYKCNLTCSHCDYWKKDPTIAEDKIMLATEKIAKSDTFIVNLSGGEIFLIPNIREVISLLKKSGKYIRINTNALIIDDYLDFLLEIQVDSIVISIDSIYPEQHDQNRGVKGLFDKCLKALDYIKKNRKGSKPETSVRCVVMKYNIDQIDDYIRFFVSRTDELGFQPIHDDSDKHKVVNSKVLFNITDEPHVREVIDSLTSKYDFLNNSYFRSFPNFIFHPERLAKASINYCLPILYNSLTIIPNGTCLMCTQTIGNIFEQKLVDIWNSTDKKTFLKSLVCNGECKKPCWLNSSSTKNPTMGKPTKLLIKLMR